MPHQRRAYVIAHQLRLPLSWMEAIAERPERTATEFVEYAARRALDAYPRKSARLVERINRERTIAKPADVLHLELCGALVRRIREVAGKYNTGHFLRLAVRESLGL